MSKKGFIIDVPQALILSGTSSYHLKSASSGSIQFTSSTVDIKGGWSLYDLASIPSGVGIAVTMADTMITGDAIDMAMGAEKTEATSVESYEFGVPYTVSDTNTITLPYAANEKSVHIAGMTEVASADEVVANTYFVSVTGNTTTVTFHTDMVDKEVIPAFTHTVADSETHTIYDNSAPKKGKVILKFPVYSSGDADSSITDICQITIFSASVNQNMTIGGSYKSAQTYEVSIKGLDPGRTDKKIFVIDFIPYAA